MAAWPRLLNSMLVACLVVLSSATVAVAATSPSPSPSPGSPAVFIPSDHNHISWLSSLAYDVTDPDTGEVRTYTFSDVTVTYWCKADNCSLVATGGTSETAAFTAADVFSFGVDLDNLVFDQDGTYQAAHGSRGDLCNEEPEAPFPLAPGTIAITATATDFSYVHDTELWVEDCSSSNKTLLFAAHRVFSGTYLDGDPCVLDGQDCEPNPILPTDLDGVQDAVSDTIDAVAAERELAVSSTVSRIDSGAAAAPSVLSALIPVQDSKMGLLDLCVAAFVTIILSLLVALPKRLYSAAIGAVPKRWNGYKDWVAARTSRANLVWHSVLTRLQRPPVSVEPDVEVDPRVEPNHGIGSGPWRKAAIGVVAAGVISAFVDPGFGFNWGSLRVALSLGSGFLLNVVIGWSVAIWIARRFNPNLTASYQFKPLSLVIVAVAVLFTRLTGMEPGMVFGLVAGVALGKMASKAAEASVAVAQTGYAFALGFAGWLAYSAVTPALGDSSNVLVKLFVDMLAGLSVAGFAAAPIALLPVAGMGGTKVFEWNPKVWFVLYSVGLVGFFWVLMPMSYSWKEIDFPIKAWVVLYVAYSAIALVAYLALVRPWERPQATESDNAEDDLDVDDFADEAIGDTGRTDTGQANTDPSQGDHESAPR